MSIKNARKIGFIASLAMLVGTVIGIGIFFKNSSVKGTTEGNGATWLLAWIVGGILSLSAAVSFSEIGSIKTDKVSGLPNWAEKVVGKKFGYFTRFHFTFLYYGLFVPVFGIFISQSFFQFIIEIGGMAQQPKIWIHILIGIFLTIIPVVIRIVSIYTSGIIQILTTALKIIPLIIAVLVGVSLATTHNVDGGINGFAFGSFNISKLVAALPAVLFAYDAFLNASQLSEKTKGGTKTVSKVVLVGMIFITIIYSLVALASILHSQIKLDKGGGIEDLLKDSLSKSSAKVLGIFVWFFITVSAYGVHNGFASSSITLFEECINRPTFFGVRKLKEKFGTQKASWILAAIIYAIWTILFSVPAILMDSDKLIDGYTNFPTLFFFGVYGIVILFYTLKRNKMNETTKISNILYKVCAWTAIIGIAAVMGWQIFHTQTMEVWLKPNGKTSWGFLVAGNYVVTKTIEFWTFTAFAILFLGLPQLNKYLMKRYENIDPVQ